MSDGGVSKGHGKAGRENYKSIKSSVVTRWLSRHRETELGNSVQKDMSTVITCLLSGSLLSKIHEVDDPDEDEPSEKLPRVDDWMTY